MSIPFCGQISAAPICHTHTYQQPRWIMGCSVSLRCTVIHSQLALTSAKTLSSLTTPWSTGIFSSDTLCVCFTYFSQYIFAQTIYFIESHPRWHHFTDFSSAALAWRVLTYIYRLLAGLWRRPSRNLCLVPLIGCFALP